MSFALLYFAVVTAAIAAYALGYRHGNRDGNSCGFDEGYEFATRDSEVRWRLTARGTEAADAMERQALAELHVHPMFLEKSPTPEP